MKLNCGIPTEQQSDSSLTFCLMLASVIFTHIL